MTAGPARHSCCVRENGRGLLSGSVPGLAGRRQGGHVRKIESRACQARTREAPARYGGSRRTSRRRRKAPGRPAGRFGPLEFPKAGWSAIPIPRIPEIRVPAANDPQTVK